MTMTIKSYKDLQAADLEKMDQAAEADAGQEIPGLRESLGELKAGKFAAVHTTNATQDQRNGCGSQKTKNPKRSKITWGPSLAKTDDFAGSST